VRAWAHQGRWVQVWAHQAEPPQPPQPQPQPQPRPRPRPGPRHAGLSEEPALPCRRPEAPTVAPAAGAQGALAPELRPLPPRLLRPEKTQRGPGLLRGSRSLGCALGFLETLLRPSLSRRERERNMAARWGRGRGRGRGGGGGAPFRWEGWGASLTGRLKGSGTGVTGVQGYRGTGTGVQGYRGTGVQGYRGTGVQGYRGTGIYS